MTPFDHPEFDDHEQIVFCRDQDAGLFGIIAIHNTRLGPAAGGCRMHPYASAEDALTDVLRLSRGMTYKNAVAGLPLGGGKSVIVADPKTSHKAALLRSFANYVQALSGRYWAAIDVGVGPADADVLAGGCDYVIARASQYPGGFNAGLLTALGGFVGLGAAVKHALDRDDLRGLRVAVQGVGNTGRELCRQLHAAGAVLTVADIDSAAVDYVVDHYGAAAVDPAVIHAQDVDVYSPCALGAVVTDATLPDIKAGVICGLANNQLAAPRHGAALMARGITYVPDFVVNAGGIIGASSVIFAAPDPDASRARVLGLYDTVRDILERSRQTGRPTSDIAEDIARERIAAGPPARSAQPFTIDTPTPAHVDLH